MGEALRDAQDMLAHERRLVKELYASKVRYGGAFDHAAVGIAIALPDGRWVEVNRALSDLLGYEGAELLSIPYAALTHPDDLAATLPLLHRAMAGEIGRYQLEQRFMRKDGQVVWAALNVVVVRDDAGAPSYLIAQMLDISERKRAEQVLRESESRYRSLSLTAPVGIFQSDGEARVTYVNPRVLQIFEIEEHAGLGHGWLVRVHPDEVEGLMSRWRTAVGAGAEFEHEYRLRLPGGAIRWVRCRAAPVQLTRGQTTGTVGTVEDITEQKVLEAQLRQAQKMEAVGQLAGGVAHDFNNLLTVINVHAELALESVQGNECLKTDLSEIARAAGRAAALTRQLLAFSRKQVLQPQLLDLHDVFASVGPMLSRLIGEDIEVITRVASDVGYVRADPGQLEQVLVNLAVNARDAMPGGGTLVLEASNIELGSGQARSHAGVPAGRYVRLEVRDTGCGMTPADRERIFEPFFTTKPVGQGTGLGLPTVYGIVRQSGGHIWVESEVGRGSTFTICLPRIAEAGDPASVAAPVIPGPRGAETVLVAEDEVAVRRLTKRILERQGYQVLEARDGRHAIELATRHAGPIDLLLTDMVMPEMNGRALAEQLCRLRPSLRVLYMSGYTDDDIVRRGMLGPGTGFLEKPFTPDMLARAIRVALD